MNHVINTVIYKSTFFIIVLPLLIMSGCNIDENGDAELVGSWNVTTWEEDGNPNPDVTSFQLVMQITETTITLSGSSFPFVYTGGYTIDENNHVEATLNETTGNSEINQYEWSVDATITSSNLELTGTRIRRSPFWPDESGSLEITASR